MATTRSKLQKEAQSAILQYAFFRWESAVVVAGTILLTLLFPRPFPWWPVWGWPVLGSLGVAAIVLSSLTDSEANARVLLSLFQEQFNPGDIEDESLRQEVESALAHQRRIETLIQEQRDGVLRDRLEDSANQLSDWIANVHRLALKLDAYRRDDLLARERESVPQEIEDMAARRERERDPEVREELDRVLKSKGRQWETLRALDARMRQAELRLEESTTALSTVYGQIQLVGARDVDSGRSERLQADIREEIDQLNDLISSIEEISQRHVAAGSGN
ncbi:MAG: hypothetical protein PVH50_02215 [Anaerolineae bacterium]|jgi:hypothetical protein